MIVPYTPPVVAIVPLFPAMTQRESVCRKRKPSHSWWMPVDYESQCLTHKRLLQDGWIPQRWEVIA